LDGTPEGGAGTGDRARQDHGGGSSRQFDLQPSEIEEWIDQGKAGMENALRAKPEDVREQYERQLAGAHRHRFETQQHAMRVIGDWRIGFYNHRRPHQALGIKTPAQAYALADWLCRNRWVITLHHEGDIGPRKFKIGQLKN